MKNIGAFLVILLALVSCYPEGPELYEDLDLVFTNYDKQFDFADKRTYAIPDSIVKITGNLLEGQDPEFVREPINSDILQRIEQNMTELGWAKTTDPATADLVLLPAVWTNTTIFYWYNYWCWYYPYTCGWGFGYPTATSYTTGTFVMTLVADGEEYVDPASVWTGAVNGMLSGAVDMSRVNDGIDQAFEQSPYLKIN